MKWTDHKIAKLMAMKAQGKTDREVGRYFGLSEKAINSKYYTFRKKEGLAIGPPGRPTSYPRHKGAPRVVMQTTRGTLKSDVRAEKLAHAEHVRSALLRPASLTAWICGDPLPGRSALDQKRGITT